MNASDRVRLVDLRRQLEPLAPDLEEIASRVIRSGWFLFGKETQEFERAFADWLDIEHVVGCANGTDAVTLALESLGVGEGDMVITVPNTAFPTACAISRTGATPVFVDIDKDTWLMDIDGAAGTVDERTKAIIPVHLYGFAVDVPTLREKLPGGVAIVEDCAQAHGAKLAGRHVGAFSDMAAYSFYPTKNLCAFGDAGAVATGDARLADRARALRFYGQERRDHHTDIGMNSRVDEIQAAFLRFELEHHLDGWVSRRRQIAARYDSELDPRLYRRPSRHADSDPSYHLYVVMVEERDAFRRFLDSEGIDTAVHYPVPIPQQPAYRSLGRSRGDFPHAEALADRIVSLPVAPHLTEPEVERVIRACDRFARTGGGR
jgi:dTDP-4-amino-4,6-dideoxygalactose transaminase